VFWGGGINVEIAEAAKTVEISGARAGEASIVDEVLKTERPGRSGAKYIFAGTVYRYFNEIQFLLAGRFTLVTICKVLERRGDLPENCDPCSFRKAYRRELSRRESAAKFQDGVKRGQKENADDAKSGKTIEPLQRPSESAPLDTRESSDEEYEKERIKELTSILVDTGTGVIRKFSNGSFEF
jgi:hypothetical protein